MELKGKKVNFLGDSITEGHGTSSEEYRFTNIIQREYGLSEARNYGIGGTRIARQRKPSEDARWDLDFCGRYSQMEDDADIVVVFGGTNDFGHGDAPFGNINDTDVYTFCGSCNVLYDGLRSKYPHIPIVVVTPTHRDNENNPKGDGYKDFDCILAEYVQAIKKVAENHGFFVLDLFDEKENSDVCLLKKEFFPDGLHPDNRGHRVLAKLIAEYLEKLN